MNNNIDFTKFDIGRDLVSAFYIVRDYYVANFPHIYKNIIIKYN